MGITIYTHSRHTPFPSGESHWRIAAGRAKSGECAPISDRTYHIVHTQAPAGSLTRSMEAYTFFAFRGFRARHVTVCVRPADTASSLLRAANTRRTSDEINAKLVPEALPVGLFV